MILSLVKIKSVKFVVIIEFVRVIRIPAVMHGLNLYESDILYRFSDVFDVRVPPSAVMYRVDFYVTH